MSRRWVGALLVVAALAVIAQNVVFFTGLEGNAAAIDEAIEAELEDEDGSHEQAESLETITYEATREYLETLPNLDVPRSPFLSLDEALRLAGLPAGTELSFDGVLPNPALDGTLWSRERRVAWLNGRPHSEGEQVTGFRIERIDPGSVLLTLDERKVLVTMESERDSRTRKGAGGEARPSEGNNDDS